MRSPSDSARTCFHAVRQRNQKSALQGQILLAALRRDASKSGNLARPRHSRLRARTRPSRHAHVHRSSGTFAVDHPRLRHRLRRLPRRSGASSARPAASRDARKPRAFPSRSIHRARAERRPEPPPAPPPPSPARDADPPPTPPISHRSAPSGARRPRSRTSSRPRTPPRRRFRCVARATNGAIAPLGVPRADPVRSIDRSRALALAASVTLHPSPPHALTTPPLPHVRTSPPARTKPSPLQADEPVFGARAKLASARAWNAAVDRVFGDLVKFLAERRL